MQKSYRFLSSKVKFLVIILLVLGIFFRFANLDRKIYWYDETVTSVRISGYLRKEVVQQITGRISSPQDLQQYLSTNSEKDWTDTVRGLAIEEAQFPPLYFVAVRLWTQLFGPSVTAIRSFSALLSVLVFPCVYWLCLELFESSLVAWLAVVLMAVSPFHILYAHEARPYSLWMVTTLLSSAALLRAMRIQNKFSWGIYAATVGLSLYSFLFSGLVLVGHGIYVISVNGFRLSKSLLSYLLAALVGFLTFTPWILTIALNFSRVQRVTGWTAKEIGVVALIKAHVRNVGRIFVDFELSKYLVPLIVILIAFSLYFLCRNTTKRVWLFVWTLTGTTILALVLPDLIVGGQRSTVSRYLIPYYLGIQLSIAYFFAAQMTSINTQRQKLWSIIFVVLISCGILSGVVSTQSQTAWTKGGRNNSTYLVAPIVNQYPQPLIISSDHDSRNLTRLLSLSYSLKPEAKIQFLVESDVPEIPDNFTDVFLFNTSENLRDSLEQGQGYQAESVYQSSSTQLWKLSR